MKAKSSKLDPHADRLTEWLTPIQEGGQGLTLAQAIEQLAQDGCKVSAGRLSEWWSEQCSQRLQERLLGQIASGATLNRKLDQAFSENPSPQLEGIITLLKHLVMQLSVQGQADPKMLELVVQLMRPIMEFFKEQGKNRDRKLDQEKFELETCELFLKWSKDARAREIAESNASNAEKIAQLRQTYFADVDELEKSGQVKIPEA